MQHDIAVFERQVFGLNDDEGLMAVAPELLILDALGPAGSYHAHEQTQSFEAARG